MRCPCCAHAPFGLAVTRGAANAPAFEELARHTEWHLTRGPQGGDAHEQLQQGVIGGFADSLPQVSIDAGLAPAPGCKLMLSTVRDANGKSQWERHVDRCGACGAVSWRKASSSI